MQGQSGCPQAALPPDPQIQTAQYLNSHPHYHHTIQRQLSPPNQPTITSSSIHHSTTKPRQLPSLPSPQCAPHKHTNQPPPKQAPTLPTPHHTTFTILHHLPSATPLLSLLPLLLLLSSTSPIARADLTRYIGNTTYPLQDQLAYCDTLGPLYDGILYDLRHWNNSIGITAEALAQASARYTTVGHQKGVTLAFYDGMAYVIEEPQLPGLGHHVNILFTYMLVMLDLQRQYGKEIPDCEFVIASSDRPLVLTAAAAQGDAGAGVLPPVMRFCSSDEHADIRIPIFHFYTKKYDHVYLAAGQQLADRMVWEQRQPVLFGRFSKYYRQIHPLANSTHRRGAGNVSICRQESTFTLSCSVRAHFMEWSNRHHSDLMDVRSGPRASLEKHAEYKYLLHLDGQALSSRLEQLLPLRSLILKEESGYTGFYHHLVKPYEHYLPVWRRGSGPEDVLAALRWAKEHDERAQHIAAAAQSVAQRYLSKRARSCYWLRLLQSYASLQRFTPAPTTRPYRVIVEEYLETVGRRWEHGKQLHKIEY